MDTKGEVNIIEKDRMQESARKSRTADRHKRIQCKVCLREMRSNNLKRHMKTHEKRKEIQQHSNVQESSLELTKLIQKIVSEELAKEREKSVAEDKEKVKDCQFQFTSYITGYYYYRHRWTPYISQELTTMCEMDNTYDKFAVSVHSNDMIVGHVPREVSQQFTTVLKSGGNIQVKVTREPFNTGNKGLRVPCMYTVNGEEKHLEGVKTAVYNIN